MGGTLARTDADGADAGTDRSWRRRRWHGSMLTAPTLARIDA